MQQKHEDKGNTNGEARGELNDKERAELADAKKQAEYRKAYLDQLRKLQCPGCGDTDIV